MNADLIAKLEAGVQHLTNANQDHCAEENGIGWNGRDQGLGHSLAHQVGQWSSGQIKAAWRMLQTYRKTQLAHLDIPEFDDERSSAVITEVVEKRDQAKVAAFESQEGWGLKWTGPKQVTLPKGVFNVWSAAIPQNHVFWTIWKRSKTDLVNKGYTVRQFNGWQVSRWEKVEAEVRVKAVEVAYSIQPLTRPDGLLSYQGPSVQGLVASLRSFNASLDASDVGTGKTYTSLACMREMGISPVVVAPLTVLPSWERAAKHLGVSIRAINWDKVRTGNTPLGKWDSDAKKSFSWAKDVDGLIFDEVHRAKSHKTMNHHLVAGAKRQNIPTLALSATAASNPLQMKALGFLLGLHHYKGFWAWVEKYGCFANRWGGYEFDGNPRHLQALHAQIFPKKGVRVRVSDLGDAFPETQVATELVTVAKPELINRAFEDVAEALAAIADKKMHDPEHHLTKLLRARQTSELAKIPALIQMAEDALEQNMSVAIFVNFEETLNAVSAHLGKDNTVVQIHGQQTPEERQAAIDAFQNDRARVIVANIKAGGVGVSLHDLNGKHPRMALISPTWSAIDLRQALGRVHRAGGKTKSLQRIVFAAGTVEERVAKMVEEKLSHLDALNDGELSAV
jgi:superfamily II DNA or RNA helicase